ncbi:MAG: glycosyltransferase family 39 protein [Chitinophagaceae bacterium]
MNFSPLSYRLKLLLVFIFCAVQVGLLLHFGIYTKEEAVKYLYEAEHFKTFAHFSQPKYIFYSGYIFLQLLADITGTGIIGLYIFQLLLNGFAAICFYRLVRNISGKEGTAFTATLLLLLCIPFQKWTVFLFTESVFFSLLIIYCYVLFAKFNRRYAKPVLLSLLLFLLIICRPTGMLVIPASLALVSHHLFVNRQKLWAALIWLPGLIGLIFLLDTAMKGKGEFDFIAPFVQEHIICGLPGNAAAGRAEAENSLWGLLLYVLNHFIDFIKLGFARLVAFFGMFRSYYSGLHNLLLMASFYPVYILASFAIRHSFRNQRRFFIFSVTLVATFAISVMLTCDDWHNRFIMPVMPIIFIYAAIGGTLLYNIIYRRKN